MREEHLRQRRNGNSHSSEAEEGMGLTRNGMKVTVA